MVIKQLNTESLRLKIELIYLLHEFIKDLENRNEDIKNIILYNKQEFELLLEGEDLPKGILLIN